MRAPRAALLLAATLALVATGAGGCSGIPTSGEVQQGREIGAVRVVDRSVLVAGPETGDGPEQVVRGFLQAHAGFQNSHQVARRYLTNGPRWRSDTTTTIYRDGGGLSISLRALNSTLGTARVVVGAQVAATIDSTGVYRAAPPGTGWSAALDLSQVGGQWRVTDPPDGIILSANVFQFVFARFPVYFVDPSGSYLVPDLRWFPTTPGTTTSLVRALLAGPSPWLASAVTTGAPPGTRLASAAVVVSEEVATVDLSPQVLEATAQQRRLLALQLRATVSSVQVRDFRVTVRQNVFIASAAAETAIAAADADPAPVVDPKGDPDPVVIDEDGVVARVTGRSVVPVQGLDALALPGIEMPATDATGSTFAVLTDQRSRVLVSVPDAVEPARVLVTGADLTAPSIDPRGWTWTASAAGGGAIDVARPVEGRFTVQAPWLSGLRVVSLRVSRDGSRLLVAATSQTRAWLLVAGIQRSSTGSPVRVGVAEDLIPDLQSVVDAAWADELNVVFLGSRGGVGATATDATAPVQPWRALVGGPAEALPPVEGARTVAARSAEEVFVATDSGRLLQAQGSGWAQIGVGSWVSMPG